jgi:hypothetical protein
VFTQRLTLQQKYDIVQALKALLRSRSRGVGVFAHKGDVPDVLAWRIIETMACGRTGLPVPYLVRREVVDVTFHLRYDTKVKRTIAERALAAIIREEIDQYRFVPIPTGTNRTDIGGNIPEHLIVTAREAPSVRSLSVRRPC